MERVKIWPQIQQLLPGFGLMMAVVADAPRLAEVTDSHRAADVLDILALPEIIDWRNAYRAFGLKPSDHRSSVEALLRRPQLCVGIPFVDYYNTLSINHRATMGAYDASSVRELEVRPACEGDLFEPIGSAYIAIKPGVFCYCEHHEIICYGLNHRDARRTAVSQESRKVVVITEYVSDATRHASEAAMRQLLADCEAADVEVAFRNL